jgi:hypothetical protein
MVAYLDGLFDWLGDMAYPSDSSLEWATYEFTKPDLTRTIDSQSQEKGRGVKFLQVTTNSLVGCNHGYKKSFSLDLKNYLGFPLCQKRESECEGRSKLTFNHIVTCGHLSPVIYVCDCSFWAEHGISVICIMYIAKGRNCEKYLSIFIDPAYKGLSTVKHICCY